MILTIWDHLWIIQFPLTGTRLLTDEGVGCLGDRIKENIQSGVQRFRWDRAVSSPIGV